MKWRFRQYFRQKTSFSFESCAYLVYFNNEVGSSIEVETYRLAYYRSNY